MIQGISEITAFRGGYFFSEVEKKLIYRLNIFEHIIDKTNYNLYNKRE